MNSTSEQFRRRRLRLVLVLVCCFAASAANLALAGQAQEASIIGQVTDESRAILPGVTVTATSPALQVPQVIGVSDERGEYRLAPLPIGTYTVEYTLPGFQTGRQENVRLTAGFVARLDVQMNVGALAETVTVSGAAPVVDVASTSARTQLTRENLEIIPTGRSGIQSVMAQAPGVRTNLDVGNMSGNPDFRAFGQSFDSWTTMEGVGVTSSKSASNGSGAYFDYSAIEESTVQTLGSGAESPTRGVQLNVILKSGGNDFHGSTYWSQAPKGLQSDNIDDALRAQGITSGNPVDARWDLSGELGGRIIRNKLWFYVGGRGRTENTQILKAFEPDGSPAVSPVFYAFITEKVSYQMSPSNKLIGFHQRLHREAEEVISEFRDWDSRQDKKYRVDTGKIEWQIAKGNKFASFQAGAWSWDLVRLGFSDQVSTTDQLSQRVTGINSDANTKTFDGRKHAKGALSWYVPDLFMGNHDFKTGFDYMVANADRMNWDRGVAGNYQLIFRNGVPFQMAALNNPVIPAGYVPYLGIYLQDRWTIARRLTLNLGLRYAHDGGYLPAQCRVAAQAPFDTLYAAQCWPQIDFQTWDPIVPRVHAAFDVTGDGKTVIKGGWGRFAQVRYADELGMVNQNNFLTTTYRWTDPNGNKLFDPGEINLDQNGPDFISTTLLAADAAAFGVPNPNATEPMSDELSLSLERQVINNVAVRLTGIYSRNTGQYRLQNNKRPYSAYNIPITNRDPGPDRTLGTGDDPGTVITYYDYPNNLSGAAFQEPMLVNDDSINSDFMSYEVAVSKRLTNGWMFMGSYSATKSHIPVIPNTGGGFTIGVPTLDPNAEIFAADNTWEWLGRLSGAYLFPASVQLSVNFEHRSGLPQARTLSVTGGQQIPSLTLRVEPIGELRLPNINLLNFRVEKAFLMGGGRKLAVQLNLFNALNVNTVTARTVLSGPAFLRPTAIMPPRIVEYGLTYSF